jgi:hypothetical protein
LLSIKRPRTMVGLRRERGGDSDEMSEHPYNTKSKLNHQREHWHLSTELK